MTGGAVSPDTGTAAAGREPDVMAYFGPAVARRTGFDPHRDRANYSSDSRKIASGAPAPLAGASVFGDDADKKIRSLSAARNRVSCDGADVL